MYARTTTLRGDPQAVESLVGYVRDEVMPAAREQDGFVGLSLLADRDAGRCIVTTAWTSAETRRASGETLRSSREHGAQIMGATSPEVQEWEIAVLHRSRESGDGAHARITWAQTDPGQVDHALEVWRSTVLPRLQELPGFCGQSMLVDRDAGLLVGVVSLADSQALEQSRERVRTVREGNVEQMGARVLEVAEMQLVLAHLRVPETV